jgi:phosphomannomutase
MGRIKSFKAYDIRGVFGKDFTTDHAYKAGFHLPALLSTTKILVGRDARLSSPVIYEHFCKGVCDAGADVYDLGLATTPMVYYFTAKEGFDASVQITASHNPREYNGLKISTTGATPVGYDTGLNRLEQMILDIEMKPSASRGCIIPYEKRDDYLTFLRQFALDYQEMRIAVDCSNGMAGLYIHDLLGESPEYIFDTPDGSFPNHEPNPLDLKNLHELQLLVKNKKCDLGVIFDGDADRVMFVDENGVFVPPDLIIGLLGHYFKEECGETGIVIQDIRTSKAVGEYLTPMGFEMHTWRVGRAFASPRLRDLKGIFGGELAGHYYFRDFYYSDSGFLACLLVLRTLQRLKKKGLSFSQILSKIGTYANSGEINFTLEKKTEAMDAVKNHFMGVAKPDAFFDFDGYRMEYPDFWFNIRPSNTEPFLRFIAEAKTTEMLEKVINEVREIIRNFE